MSRIALHCSHEQISPSRLLRAARRAEQAGFDGAMSSDHFAPWSQRQGESGFAWSFLGAALASTQLPFGVVNAPGQRYHPAIIALVGDERDRSRGNLGAIARKARLELEELQQQREPGWGRTGLVGYQCPIGVKHVHDATSSSGSHSCCFAAPFPTCGDHRNPA